MNMSAPEFDGFSTFKNELEKNGPYEFVRCQVRRKRI
jgi:hypothetical protein